jgi:hypothetical protein
MGLKLEYQPYRSPENWYYFTYPEYWELEVIEGVPAFFDPEGSGAFIISAFLNKAGVYDLTEEMGRFLAQHKIKHDPSKIASFDRTDGTKVQACEFVADGRFWLVYLLAFQNKLLICTYNSDETPDRELAEILTTMISSIRFTILD